MLGREHGSKVGSGGTNSGLAAELHRRQLTKDLMFDKIDISKDPYIMKNHLGTYDCRLCMTTHPNEGNYIAHRNGRRHKTGLARRALRDAQLNPGPQPLGAANANKKKVVKKARIGRPVFRSLKQFDPETKERSLLFMIEYPEILDGLQPRIRIISPYEQRLERTNDHSWQYLLFAAEPYYTIAFKIPNDPIEREFDPNSGRMKFWTNWDAQKKIFSLQLYFKRQESAEAPSTSSAPNGSSDAHNQDYEDWENPEM